MAKIVLRSLLPEGVNHVEAARVLNYDPTYFNTILSGSALPGRKLLAAIQIHYPKLGEVLAKRRKALG